MEETALIENPQNKTVHRRSNVRLLGYSVIYTLDSRTLEAVKSAKIYHPPLTIFCLFSGKAHLPSNF